MRQHGAGDEGGLLLEDGVVDRGAETFVEDLDAEQLGRGGGAVLVGGGDGDVEGQDLVGVPGRGDFLEALDLGEGDVIELVGGGVDRQGNIAGDGGVEGAGGVGGEIEVLLELGTDIVAVGEKRADGWLTGVLAYSYEYF